ncbi:hypothetical protein [Rhodococcus koreensis]
MSWSTDVAHAHIFTMRELNQDTAEVMRKINKSGRPAAITRRGRFIALITPLANARVESAVLGAVIAEAENSSQLTGETTESEFIAADDLAADLGIDVPPAKARELSQRGAGVGIPKLLRLRTASDETVEFDLSDLHPDQRHEIRTLASGTVDEDTVAAVRAKIREFRIKLPGQE